MKMAFLIVSESRLRRRVLDVHFTPPFFLSCSFFNACEGHDTCYSTCNSKRSSCDNKFYNDMKATCEDCARNHFQSIYQCEILAAKDMDVGVDVAGRCPAGQPPPTASSWWAGGRCLSCSASPAKPSQPLVELRL